MISKLINSNLILIFLISLSITACGGKLPGADAKKVSPDPRERVRKNLEEGKGFRLNTAIKDRMGRGGNFEFASSNELWRASLDIIEFMPLTSANYSGGIIITDWYSNNTDPNETIKITIRFLSNEIRSDSVDINIFYKNCVSINNCSINKKEGPLKKQLTKKILTKAAVYKKQSKDKNFKKKNRKSSPDN